MLLESGGIDFDPEIAALNEGEITGLDYYEKGHAPLVGEGRLPWSDDWSDLATQAGLLLMWVAALLTAITGWDYFQKARPWLRDVR